MRQMSPGVGGTVRERRRAVQEINRQKRNPQRDGYGNQKVHPGLEPGISRFVGEHVDHCASKP